MQKSLTISIDYDGTYTADKGLWVQFAQIAKGLGHKVIVCTGRNEEAEIKMELDGIVDDVVFAGTEHKSEAVRQKHYSVDIWVDDDPAHIFPTTDRGDQLLEPDWQEFKDDTWMSNQFDAWIICEHGHRQSDTYSVCVSSSVPSYPKRAGLKRWAYYKTAKFFDPKLVDVNLLGRSTLLIEGNDDKLLIGFLRADCIKWDSVKRFAVMRKDTSTS